jgi:hypothetical protein
VLRWHNFLYTHFNTCQARHSALQAGDAQILGIRVDGLAVHHATVN